MSHMYIMWKPTVASSNWSIGIYMKLSTADKQYMPPPPPKKKELGLDNELLPTESTPWLIQKPCVG